MPDHFATLNLPRRPWLDAGVVTDAFHRVAAEVHPDAPGGTASAFAAANEAWQAVRDPAMRLRHLLELESAELLARPAEIPAAVADVFMQVAQVRQALETQRRREAAATSPLARALLAGDRAEIARAAETLRLALAAAEAAATADLRALDDSWQPQDAASLEAAAGLQQRFAFLGKWAAQLREAVFQFSSAS